MRSMKSIRLLAVSICLLLFTATGNFVLASTQSPTIQSSGVITYSESTTAIKKALVLWGSSGALSNGGSGNWATDKVGWCAKFDLVSLEFQVTNVAAIHQRNPNTKVIGYKDLIGMKPDMPDWDEVNQHEDWFYHDIYGNRLQTDPDSLWGWYLMDIRSQGWRQHYVDFISHFLVNHDFDGVFADDCWTGLYKNWFTWKYPADTIPNQPSWENDMKNFLSYIKSRISSKLLLINNGHTGVYLTYVDGSYLENFVFQWGTPKQYVDELFQQSATKKSIVAWPHRSSYEGKGNFMFAFACYLLGINGPNACFGWIDGWQPSHGYYPEMDTDPGVPLGSYRVENGLYVRDFKNLRVVVDMTAKTGQILPLG